MPSSSIKRKEREPRWIAFIAMLADGLVYLALPERLSLGPGWLLLAVILVLLIPINITYYRGRYDVTRTLTFGVMAVITLALVGSLALLIQGLPQHRDSPVTLLRSASALWITNVLVFALWYWKLDAGGPLGRDEAGRYQGSFLFPQMLLKGEGAENSWSPNFLDYLFLAFNTSTAFSPTDTAVLSRGAKLAMMLQSLISLSVVIVLLARAIGML
jgi:uncharacterized membrane protein